MTAVPVSPVFEAMLQPPALCRNGQVVGAVVETSMRQHMNQVLVLRGKELFAYAGPLSSIPSTATGSRVRWRFRAHASPFCRRLHVHVLMATHNTGDPMASYAYFTDPNYGILRFYFGATNGGTDLPSEFGYAHDVINVDSDNDIVGEFGDVDGARLIAAVVYEEMLVPDTTYGHRPDVSVGTNIYDGDRQNLAVVAQAVWYSQGSQVWNWTTDTAAAAFTNTTTQFKNIINSAVTTVSAASPGATLDMTGKAVSRQESAGVPVKMLVYASITAQTGVVKLVDSAGATVLSVAITAGANWYTVAGVLPASAGKYDLQGALNSIASGTLTVHAVSIYEEGTGNTTGLGWSVDATSGVAKPANSTEYAAWIAANSLTTAAPGSLFNCTEATANANLADAIGSRTLTRNGTTVGAQAVTGWTATGVKVTNTATSWWQFTGEDLSTTNVAAFAILDPNTISLGTIVSFGGGSLSSSTEVELLASGKFRARRAGATVDSTNTYTGPVAMFIVCRQSASNFSVYLKPIGSGSIETLTPTWSTPPSGASVMYLASGWETASVDATFLEFDYWTGTDATITSAQVSAFFTARGV